MSLQDEGEKEKDNRNTEEGKGRDRRRKASERAEGGRMSHEGCVRVHLVASD